MNNKQHSIGLLGMSCGAIALLLALFHYWAGPFTQQSTLSQNLSKNVASIKQSTIDLFTHNSTTKVQETHNSHDLFTNKDKLLRVIIAILSGFAICLGVFSYALKESPRIASSAVFLGSCAIAFQLSVFFLGIFIILILVICVFSLKKNNR